MRASTSASRQRPASARARASARPCSRPASTASSPPTPGAAASRSSMRASSGNGGGSSPSDGRVGRQRVAVLGPADAAPRLALDREQADVAHALEVGPHGVDVQVRASRRCRRWPAGAATGPARGRSRSGCCRPAPSGRRVAGAGRHRHRSPRDYTASPVKCGPCHDRRPPPPTRRLMGLLRGVIDPELGSDIVELGMAEVARCRRRRPGHRSPSPSPRPAARCGRRSRRTSAPASASLPGVTEVKHRLDRADPGREGRGHGQGPLERHRARRATPRSAPPPR